MKKLVLVTAIAAATFGAVSTAQAVEVTTTANANITTDYKFRGISQTNSGPAFQGGFDAAFSNGFYIGNWNSNVNNVGPNSAGLEMDLYAGYASEFKGVGYDVGALYYYYNGADSSLNADTTEIYGKLSYAGAYAKLSYAVSSDYFAFVDQSGSTYLDLGYTFPLSEKLSLTAHYGLTSYDKDIADSRPGATGTIDSYSDYSIGATYAISPKYSVTAAYVEAEDKAAGLIAGGADDFTEGSLIFTLSAKF